VGTIHICFLDVLGFGLADVTGYRKDFRGLSQFLCVETSILFILYSS